MKKSYLPKRGFTLIELLIVVAIIGILAAIAVPNFLNAQVRAGISRVKGDFKSIDTALKSYQLDNDAFPRDEGGPNVGSGEAASYAHLTTPIAYLSSIEVCMDFFTAKSGRKDDGGVRNFYDYGMVPYVTKSGIGYVVISFGPDKAKNMPWETVSMDAMVRNRGDQLFFLYESSNGLNSAGDIIGTAIGLMNR